MNYQKALDLLDLMLEKDIRLRELMRVFNPVQKQSATKLLSGKATDKDLDVVEKELTRYSAILGAVGDTIAQSRKKTKTKADVRKVHEKATRLYRHYIEREKVKPDVKRTPPLWIYFDKKEVEKFLNQKPVSHQSIALHEQILEKYKQI